MYAQWGHYFRRLFTALDIVASWIPDQIFSVALRKFSPLGTLRWYVSPYYASRYAKLSPRPVPGASKRLRGNFTSFIPALPTLFDTLLVPHANKIAPYPAMPISPPKPSPCYSLARIPHQNPSLLAPMTSCATHSLREANERAEKCYLFHDITHSMAAEQLRDTPYLVRNIETDPSQIRNAPTG